MPDPNILQGGWTMSQVVTYNYAGGRMQPHVGIPTPWPVMIRQRPGRTYERGTPNWRVGQRCYVVNDYIQNGNWRAYLAKYDPATDTWTPKDNEITLVMGIASRPCRGKCQALTSTGQWDTRTGQLTNTMAFRVRG